MLNSGVFNFDHRDAGPPHARGQRPPVRDLPGVDVAGPQARQDLLTTRFPFPGGGYESVYLRAVDPDDRRGLWLRHTVHQAPGHDPVGSVWAVAFGDGSRRARHKVSDRVAPGWIRVGDVSAIGPDGVTGEHRRPHLGGGGRRAAAASPPRVDVPRAAAAHEVLEPAARPAPERHGDGPRARRLARHARPQLGLPARRALDLAQRPRIRGRGRRVAGRRRRPGEGRPADHAVDRVRDAQRRRRAPPGGRPREGDRGPARRPPRDRRHNRRRSLAEGGRRGLALCRIRTAPSTTRPTDRSPR